MTRRRESKPVPEFRRRTGRRSRLDTVSSFLNELFEGSPSSTSFFNYGERFEVRKTVLGTGHEISVHTDCSHVFARNEVRDDRTITRLADDLDAATRFAANKSASKIIRV